MTSLLSLRMLQILKCWQVLRVREENYSSGNTKTVKQHKTTLEDLCMYHIKDQSMVCGSACKHSFAYFLHTERNSPFAMHSLLIERKLAPGLWQDLECKRDKSIKASHCLIVLILDIDISWNVVTAPWWAAMQTALKSSFSPWKSVCWTKNGQVLGTKSKQKACCKTFDT